MKTALSIQNIYASLGGKPVLNGMTFDCEEGRVIALIGPSGSGKTTLLRCINALIPIDEGSIRVEDTLLTKDLEGVDVRRLRENVGTVFQQFNLWPHRTVLENIMDAPLLVKKMDKEAALEKADTLLARVGLTEKRQAYPSTLSGGQQQRVAIARALAMEPQVLLFDEITSSLDPELTAEVLRVIRDIAKEHKRTIIIVTHEMDFARQIADEILFMDQGQLVERGTPSAILDHPKETRTQQFLQKLVL